MGRAAGGACLLFLCGPLPHAAAEEGLELLSTGGGDLVLSAEDEREVHATFHPAIEKGRPAVVLVGAPDQRRESWSAFAAELVSRGIAALAITPRAGDAAGVPTDIRAGIRFLREREDIDGIRVAVVGASSGANAAAAYGVDDQLLVGLALVSPSPRALGFDAAESITGFGERPTFVVAARGDEVASAALDALEANSSDTMSTLVVEGDAHGTALLSSLKVKTSLVAWLDTIFAPDGS